METFSAKYSSLQCWRKQHEGCVDDDFTCECDCHYVGEVKYPSPVPEALIWAALAAGALLVVWILASLL